MEGIEKKDETIRNSQNENHYLTGLIALMEWHLREAEKIKRQIAKQIKEKNGKL